MACSGPRETLGPSDLLVAWDGIAAKDAWADARREDDQGFPKRG